MTTKNGRKPVKRHCCATRGLSDTTLVFSSLDALFVVEQIYVVEDEAELIVVDW